MSATHSQTPRTRYFVECTCPKNWTELGGCEWNTHVTFLDGTKLPSIPWLDENDYHSPEWQEFEICAQCLAGKGKFHHPGCDMEVCPRCKRQAISCWCLNYWQYYQEHPTTRQLLSSGYMCVNSVWANYTFPNGVHEGVKELTLQNAQLTDVDVIKCAIAFSEYGDLLQDHFTLWTKKPLPASN